MEKKSFYNCVVIHIFLSSFIISVNSNVIEKTRQLKKMDEQQKSFDIHDFKSNKQTLSNLTLDDEVYIFTGKILKSFYERGDESSQYKKNVVPFLQYMPKRNHFAAVVKVKRVFKGNGSNIGSFRKILLVSSSILSCHEDNEKNQGIRENRCAMLIFAKPISFAVFKAKFTFLEARANKRGEKRLQDQHKYQSSSRLRKGKEICPRIIKGLKNSPDIVQ